VGEKAELRQQIRRERARRMPAHISPEIVRQLPVITSCAGYLATAREPSIDLLLTTHLDRGDDLALPRVNNAGLEWVTVSSLAHTSPGAFGIREPHGAGEAHLPKIHAIYIPALAIDESGFRLGQGGGFYDRALTDVPSYRDGGPLRIGVVHDDEIFPTIPREAHDVRVDVICTPTQLMWIDE
jgi:5-formyltetrahydrofolate cyclo-ligase